MPVVILPESELGKEMAKWNKPYRYEPFPRMLYKAQRRPDGQVSVGEGDDRIFGGHAGAAEAFSRGCWKIVNDEREYSRAHEDGWRDTQKEALEHFESRERFKADAAAHRHYEDRNLSESARAEVEAIEAESAEHLPEIPEQPKRRRGRPRKVA
jgi:hypothetical protein